MVVLCVPAYVCWWVGRECMRGSNPKKTASFPDNEGGPWEVNWARGKHKHILACPAMLWGPEAMRV